MAADLSQFQYIIIILIFGSKVLLLAKNVFFGIISRPGFVDSEVILRQDLLQAKFFAKVAIYRLAGKKDINEKDKHNIVSL